jgi:hypothetical protein
LKKRRNRPGPGYIISCLLLDELLPDSRFSTRLTKRGDVKPPFISYSSKSKVQWYHKQTDFISIILCFHSLSPMVMTGKRRSNSCPVQCTRMIETVNTRSTLTEYVMKQILSNTTSSIELFSHVTIERRLCSCKTCTESKRSVQTLRMTDKTNSGERRIRIFVVYLQDERSPRLLKG